MGILFVISVAIYVSIFRWVSFHWKNKIQITSWEGSFQLVGKSSPFPLVETHYAIACTAVEAHFQTLQLLHQYYFTYNGVEFILSINFSFDESEEQCVWDFRFNNLNEVNQFHSSWANNNWDRLSPYSLHELYRVAYAITSIHPYSSDSCMVRVNISVA